MAPKRSSPLDGPSRGMASRGRGQHGCGGRTPRSSRQGRGETAVAPSSSSVEEGV